MSRFIKIGLSVIVSIGLCNAAMANQVYSISGYSLDDLDVLEEMIIEQEDIMEAAHQMAEAARTLNYEENHDVIVLAKQEYTEANRLKVKYQNIYNELMKHWNQKEEEYPVAAYIWSYFRDLGYNSEVCAGILGNIMTEVGGNTLDIRATVSNSRYYGMCQWNKTYSNVWGASLEEQCDYLRDTIEYEFKIFGYTYKEGFDYNNFLELTDIRSAALAFCKVYERCSSASYYTRQQNAIAAYNYFMN